MRSSDERARAWAKLTAFYSGWAYYKTLTDREIKVVALRAREGPV